MGNVWGKHLILDLRGCSITKLKDKENVKSWLKELVVAIDMKAYGEPIIEHFATHSFEAAGFSAVQLIETSNICAHFSENLGEVYIDIFSCKDFSPEIAVETTAKFFNPTVARYNFLSRDAKADIFYENEVFL